MNLEEITATWIGPTKCDEARLSRETDVENVWKIVKPLLEGKNFIPSTYGIVSLTLDLLRESLNCYQNGAYLAVCSMCRTCVEALLYSSTKLKPTDHYKIRTIKMEENYIREKRKTFLKNASDEGLIDGNDKKIIRDIWEKGDFAMHIPQKMERNSINLSNSLSKKNEKDQLYTLKGWSDKNEALKTITETAKLISKIMNNLNAFVQAKSID